MHWVVVCTKPHQEKQAQSCIRQLGIETFLPQLEEKKIARRVQKTCIGLLFPGYLFARIDLLEHYRRVKYAKGVRTIVEFGTTPAFVEDQIIESIRSRMVGNLIKLPQEPTRLGKVVRIMSGPLEGMEAVFQCHLNGPQRVMLFLRAIAYQARIIVPPDLVCNQ